MDTSVKKGDKVKVLTSQIFSDRVGTVTETTKHECTVNYGGFMVGKYIYANNKFEKVVE